MGFGLESFLMFCFCRKSSDGLFFWSCCFVSVLGGCYDLVGAEGVVFLVGELCVEGISSKCISRD